MTKKQGPLDQNPKRALSTTKSFQKDLGAWVASGQHKGHIKNLKVAIGLLENRQPLPPEFKDHPLKGKWAGYRGPHLGGDAILIYWFPDKNSVELVALGSHSELYSK